MTTIQTQSNQIQKRMSLPSLPPRHQDRKKLHRLIQVFCICKTIVGLVRCVMLAFGLFPSKEVALQVRESDSRILIRFYSYTTKSLSRHVHLLEPSSFLPILRCFVSNVRHLSYSHASHVRHCSPQVHVAQKFHFASRGLS